MNRYFRDPRTVLAEFFSFFAERAERKGKHSRASRLYRGAEDRFRAVASEVGDDFPNTKRDLEEAAAECKRRAEELE